MPWHQGLLIKRQDEITDLYAQMIAEKVITLQNIGDELLNGPRSDRTCQLLYDSLRPAVDRAVGPARAAVRVAIGTKETTTSATRSRPRPATSHRRPLQRGVQRQQAGKINTFVATQMRAMGPDDFVEMLRSAIKQDEWLLFVHGGVLGLLAGFLHLAIFGV